MSGPGPFAPIVWEPGTVWPPGDDPATQGLRTPAVSNLALFGPSISSTDVDDAVVANLQMWLPTYLTFIERSRSLTYKLARPKLGSYVSVLEPEQWLDHNLPVIAVATARSQGTPTVSADGEYLTTWLVAVSALIRGQSPQLTRRIASYYELAFRMAMVQQQRSLPSWLVGLRWVAGGEARPLADPNGKGRHLGEGASQFWVFSQGAVQEGVGPTVPDQDPYKSLATVTEVDIDVQGFSPEFDDSEEPGTPPEEPDDPATP